MNTFGSTRAGRAIPARPGKPVKPGRTHASGPKTGRAGRDARRHWVPYLFLLPALVLELFVHFGPMLAGVLMSGLKLTQYQAGWPIDRDLTAAYLGFDRAIRNARDAGMSAFDAGAELAGNLGLTLSGASRCASDLYYWSSSEVAMVRLHPSLCGTSSMMPQKRNPIALERIRALAGDAAGWAASQLGLLHFATSTDADQGYVNNRVPGYCTQTSGALALLRESIATLEIDVDRLATSAGRHWSTSSALAVIRFSPRTQLPNGPRRRRLSGRCARAAGTKWRVSPNRRHLAGLYWRRSVLLDRRFVKQDLGRYCPRPPQ
jgi:hypothetical protein